MIHLVIGRRLARFVTVALLLMCGSAAAQVPARVSYQGYLADEDGNAIDGSVDLTFRLYDRVSGGSASWVEANPQTVVSDGVFSVRLGRDESLSDVNFDDPLWLGISVGEAPELLPRVPLTAAPYALSTRGFRMIGDRENPSIVLGGESNQLEDATEGAALGGGFGNTVGGDFATVGGGIENNGAGNRATISGGSANSAAGDHSSIGGGSDNVATGDRSTISGGIYNSTDAFDATVGGGQLNIADGQGAAIGGGFRNRVSGAWSVIPGGWQNQVRGRFAFAGGHSAHAIHDGTFIWNDISSIGDSLISTGDNQFLIRAAGGVGIGTNAPSEALSVVGIVESTQGGFKFPDGTVQETAATAGEGGSAWQLGGNSGTTPETNFVGTTDDAPFELRARGQRALRIEPAERTDDAPSLVGGHAANRIESVDGGDPPFGVTISGGGGPDEGNNEEANVAAASYVAIGGGRGNRAAGHSATIGGGQFNEALTGYDTVAGGRNNRAEGGGDLTSATVGGGQNNTAANEGATVGGGRSNTATGTFSTVPGGSENTAEGYASLAAGLQARAGHDGTFVWSDRSSDEFASTAENQFLIRAAGGVGIGTNAPEGALHVTHPDDGIDLILGGAGASTFFGDDGVIASDPATESSDLLLVANDAVGIMIDADNSGETSEFIVTDSGFDEVFRVDLTGTVTTGSIELVNELGEADAPASGGIYSDNVVYAWAHVNADGSTAATFGCTVTKLDDAGRYVIAFDRSLPDGIAPVVTPHTPNPVMATVQPGTGNTQATVYLFALNPVTGEFARTDNAFFIQVVGRP